MDNESGSFAVLIVAGLPMMLYGKHYSRWSDVVACYDWWRDDIVCVVVISDWSMRHLLQDAIMV